MSEENERNPQQPAVSQWGALWRVITEPGATFGALAEKPPVLPGYLLQMVATLAVTAFTLPKTMSLTADMLAKQNVPANVAGITKIVSIVSGMVGAVLSPWIIGLILALVATFFGQFQGGSVGFTKYLGMIGYARVPLAIGALVQAPLMLRITSLADVNRVSLSLASLLPADSPGFLKAFATTLNPFDIWYYVLLALGFAALHRVKPGKSLGFVLTVYVLVLLMAFFGAKAATKVPGM